MSALGMASLGTQCSNRALGMASVGVHCALAVVRSRSGGGVKFRRITVPPGVNLDEVPHEQLLREDEELIALVVAAIHEGIIP